MNPSILKAVVEELDESLRGYLISKVYQIEPDIVILKLFGRGKSATLLLSTHPKFSRIHLSTTKFNNPDVPPRFAALLRSRLDGAVIQGITQVDGERIVRIELKKRDVAYRLVCELTGKSSNIILVGEDDVIVDAVKYFREGESERIVEPGVGLVPLPPYEGSTEKVFPEDFNSEAESVNKEAERYYGEKLKAEEFSREATTLRRIVTNARKRGVRKLKNLSADKERAEEAIEKSKLGELLVSNFHKLKRGLEAVEVEDYYLTPPKKLSVTLDPKLSPQENIDRYFKLAKKGKKTLSLLEERVPKVEASIDYLSKIGERLTEAEAMEELKEVTAELTARGFIKKKRAIPKGKGKTLALSTIERLRTTEGYEMLLGRSAKGNDKLVKEFAKPGDLWFHAKGTAGAHVVLKAKSRATRPSEKAINEAARLAAANSKNATSAKVEVIYTDAKNVRKPKGARAGAVVVEEYRSILVKVS